MGIQRYRRKPEQVNDREVQVAARYLPGTPLDDLLAVALMADGELAEVMFPSYGPVLLARFKRFYDERPSQIEYLVVEAGRYLAYDPGDGFLYASDEANWRQWYDVVETPR
jgi:hypothetical protein